MKVDAHVVTDRLASVVGAVHIERTVPELRALTESQRRDLYRIAYRGLVERFEEIVRTGQ